MEIAIGRSNAAIANTLLLIKRAVEKHVNSIFFKLDLPDTEDVSRRVKATLIFLDEQDDDPARPETSPLARRTTHRTDRLRGLKASHAPPRGAGYVAAH